MTCGRSYEPRESGMFCDQAYGPIEGQEFVVGETQSHDSRTLTRARVAAGTL